MARCQPIGLVILMAGIAGMGLLTGCGDSSDGGVPADGQQEVSDDNSKADLRDLAKEGEAKEPGLPMFLDLGSKRCIPCKMMAPILDELKRDYADQFKTAYIDVDLPENAPVVKQQYGVKRIPTLIFFDGHGKELWRYEGFMSKEAILGKWAELGFEFKQTSPKAADEQPQGLEGDE
jgi:thioredoxin 1